MMEPLMTVQEIAKILHIEPNTIQNKKWQQRTGCPLVKRGKRVYAISTDFLAWIKAGKRG